MRVSLREMGCFVCEEGKWDTDDTENADEKRIF
jgi:hypothetical protein